jgi:hypothetical protein
MTATVDPWADPLGGIGYNGASDRWGRVQSYARALVDLDREIHKLIGNVRALPSPKFDSAEMAAHRRRLAADLDMLHQVRLQIFPEEGS